MLDASTLLSEAHRRFAGQVQVRAAAEDLVHKLKSELFTAQLRVVDDRSPLKAVRCPRRAGKSSLIPRWIVIGSAETAELTQGWAISHGRAKELFWDELGRINTRHNIGGAFNDSELSIRWPWGDRAITRLKGADKAKETHKKRGDRLGRAAVDEAQEMDRSGAFLEVLIDSVLEPATQDVGGDIAVFGTPGIICKGYWYEVSCNDLSQVKKGWSPHYWHTRNNEAMPHIWSNFLAMKERKGWADDNPTWLREYMGQWVDDPEALFYAYSDARNGIDAVPVIPGMAYVLGWDLGSGGDNDPMALHVWGFSPASPNLWPVRSWKNPDAGLEETMAVVAQWEEELGGFASEVADTGGSGKVAVDYVNRRFGRAFKPAAKTEKFQHAVMFNDDLLRGVVKVLRGSPLAQEIAALPKDPEDPTREHPDYANHCTDAGLYAWREARHFWGEVPAAKPKPGTPEFAEEQERLLEEAIEEEALAEQDMREEWGF